MKGGSASLRKPQRQASFSRTASIRQLLYGFLPFNACAFEKSGRKWQQVFSRASKLYLYINRCQWELRMQDFIIKQWSYLHYKMHIMHLSLLIFTQLYLVCCKITGEWLFHTVIVMPDRHCLIIRLEGETQMLTPTRWADSFRAVTPAGEMRKWDGGRKWN